MSLMLRLVTDAGSLCKRPPLAESSKLYMGVTRAEPSRATKFARVEISFAVA